VSSAGNNTYGYDANGNMTGRNTATLTHNAENRLVGVSGAASASLVYNGDGKGCPSKFCVLGWSRAGPDATEWGFRRYGQT